MLCLGNMYVCHVCLLQLNGRGFGEGSASRNSHGRPPACALAADADRLTHARHLRNSHSKRTIRCSDANHHFTYIFFTNNHKSLLFKSSVNFSLLTVAVIDLRNINLHLLQ